MHPVGVAQTLARARRRYQPARAVALDQVLHDGARLRERGVAIGDDRRLAERVHLAQRRRREHGPRIALVALDLVLEAELLQQPQQALGARVVQVVDDDHFSRVYASAHLTVPEAVDAVVVHHADRLHEGVADGGADELEAALGEVFAQSVRFHGFYRDIFSSIHDRLAADEA